MDASVNYLVLSAALSCFSSLRPASLSRASWWRPLALQASAYRSECSTRSPCRLDWPWPPPPPSARSTQRCARTGSTKVAKSAFPTAWSYLQQEYGLMVEPPIYQLTLFVPLQTRRGVLPRTAVGRGGEGLHL